MTTTIVSESGLTEETVFAFAHTRATRSHVGRVGSLSECRRLVQTVRDKGWTITNRGGGYSNCDVILNDQQAILDTSAMNRILKWDSASGQMVVESGVLMRDILATVLPENWTLPACPGNMLVTVGGAIGNNVHGKDCWQHGNFGDQVVELKLLTANDEVLTLSRSKDSEAFHAVIGGLGLLGIVIEATLQMKPVQSAYVRETQIKVGNIREGLAVLEEAKQQDDFALFMVDPFPRGQRLGRGEIWTAKWIDEPLLINPRRLRKSLTMSKYVMGVLPAKLTWRMIRPFYGARFMRTAYPAKMMLSRLASKISPDDPNVLFPEYHFKMNKIPHMIDAYHPQGMVELQPLIPYEAVNEAIPELIRMGQRYQCESLLLGLKNHRRDDFLLSYSGDGISFGVELQLRGRNRDQMNRFARELFELTADVGGCIYLGKDELLPREQFQRMFPRYGEFLNIKRRLDPQELFASDIYRRLLAEE